jgi:ubiquinone/menaquinone biosynthesis C-methylase UbiE
MSVSPSKGKDNLDNDLSMRQKIEEEFHDIHAKDTRAVDFYNYGALSLADSFLISLMGDLKNKQILEIGCGEGTNTLKFALAGAKVTAIDISGGMVELTKNKAKEAGVGEMVLGVHVGGEDIEFPENQFDIVFGHSVLHHLNLDIATPKLVRALKPSGIGVFLEPLAHNPILNLFRRITPHRRTPTEQPLNLQQLRTMSKSFSHWEHREFYLFSLAAFFWYYVLRSERLFQLTLKHLNKVDTCTFTMIPFLRRFAWVTVIRFFK